MEGLKESPGIPDKEIFEKKRILCEKILDIMSHVGYPAGKLIIDVNCIRGSVVMIVQRDISQDKKTITISERI